MAALLPPGVDCAAVEVADHGEALKDEERALTARFVERRLRTFSSGRVAARQALGMDAAIAVLAGGAPAAPPGRRLSISHTDAVAVAIACSDRDAAGIGVDIEDVARMEPGFRRHVVGPLDRVAPDADVLRLTATFSLRESLFKTLQGAVRQGGYVRWDGDTVEVGVEGLDLPLRWAWTQVGGRVLSVCWLLP